MVRVPIDDAFVERVQRETSRGMALKEAVAKILEEESRKLTDQSKASDLENKFNSIIAPGEDIDNGEIYDRKTGETVRDL